MLTSGINYNLTPKTQHIICFFNAKTVKMLQRGKYLWHVSSFKNVMLRLLNYEGVQNVSVILLFVTVVKNIDEV